MDNEPKKNSPIGGSLSPPTVNPLTWTRYGDFHDARHRLQNPPLDAGWMTRKDPHQEANLYSPLTLHEKWNTQWRPRDSKGEGAHPTPISTHFRAYLKASEMSKIFFWKKRPTIFFLSLKLSQKQVGFQL